MRTLIDYAPFFDITKFWSERGRWPAKWVKHPKADGTGPIVLAFKRHFTVDAPQTVRIHVSADERYELYLDGQRIGRGPERGDRANWFFETYDLDLSAGEHTIVARTWWLNDFAPAPFAQISLRPGFLLAAEGDAGTMLSTGVADWQCKSLGGYRFVPPGITWGTGAKSHLIGADFPFGVERGEGNDWIKAVDVHHAIDANNVIDQANIWIMKPATLPPMLDREIRVGVARHVQAIPAITTEDQKVLAVDHLPEEAAQWNRMLKGQGSVTVPPNTLRRVIIDLENYYCAYTDLVTSGGAGAVVRSWWAESLYTDTYEQVKAAYKTRVKGNRDEIEGKSFIGIGDTFEPDGQPNRHFQTLWWEAGRYIELTVRTAADPLTIERFSLRETHYPYDWTAQFAGSDERLSDVIPIAKRVMEMCSHETYMDCPYYEQLMYVGDTRLEVLTTYTWTPDDRLPRKALRMFDESRKAPGFTQSRYPSRVQQTIPPFSAWWIGMLHDYAYWRDDRAFVVSLLPGMRGILDAFQKWRTSDGLISGPMGWNFIDWVPAWTNGMPPEGNYGISAPLNLKLAWIMKQAADLERYAGEPELAELHDRRSAELTAACLNGFWDESRGLLADDLAHKNFSEHSQCIALLGDLVTGKQATRTADNLLTAADLQRTTIYFDHYLFETYRKINRIDRLFDRLDLWFNHKMLGLKTTVEMPEPTRSDCHAWGAHPIYHYFASILGIRPGAAGFQSVDIRPQLGALTWARGAMPHPKGLIQVDLKQSNGKLTGTIDLPAGLSGTLHTAKQQSLRAGQNVL
ncbi:MAG TPA: alpha-L-rhamnosidase C-terminal domain-containing protein [Tepidisphaeraceae bacterium]|jgi:hypothetical protein|nr:alpha-L-rhamnosidase C-terminal domain-containing protein [Tepidisphaeraceae bacterium]